MELNPEIIHFGPESVAKIQTLLHEWYGKNARAFPWRETSNPFHILIAEKLLQKTAARSHVVNIYNLIIERYSTPELLSNAVEPELRNLLFPLGLFSRAKELIKLSKRIVLDYQGEIPDNHNALLHFPGVGEYIARAVLCFGFGHDIAIVDTNVARWIYRLYGIQVPFTQNPSRNKKLISLAEGFILKGKARIHNWAVLDLCASICLTGGPRCTFCPLEKICLYRQQASKLEI